jgi:putative DNA primase/helicase
VEKLEYDHQVNLQQLYAQLAEDIDRGEQWWLTRDEEAMLMAYNKRHLAISPIAERLDEYVDHQAIARGEGPYMKSIQVLSKLDIDRPTMGQCKEMAAALRNLIGPPKRVQGRDRWRVPANAKEYFVAETPEEPEAI